MSHSTALVPGTVSKTIVIPAWLAGQLAAHCGAWEESQNDAIVDALAIYLDDDERVPVQRIPLLGIVS